MFLTISAASCLKKFSSITVSTPFLFMVMPLVIPLSANCFSILVFSVAHDAIFQKSSSAVYRSCDTDFNFDNGLSNILRPLSDVIVSPKFTSSNSLVRSPSLTFEFTTPSFNNSSYKSFCCLVPFNGVCNA